MPVNARGLWVPDSAERKNLRKASSLNRKNQEFARNGNPQYIGRPQGPKAKGHKTPATAVLPYTRFSVVGKG